MSERSVWPRVGLETHAEIEVAGRATLASAAALPGEPDPLAVPDLGRKLDVEASAVVEGDSAPPAGQGLLERQLERGLVVAAAERTGAGCGTVIAEQAIEELGEHAVTELDVNAVAIPLLAEEVLEVTAATCALRARTPLAAKPVISLPLLGV